MYHSLLCIPSPSEIFAWNVPSLHISMMRTGLGGDVDTRYAHEDPHTTRGYERLLRLYPVFWAKRNAGGREADMRRGIIINKEMLFMHDRYEPLHRRRASPACSGFDILRPSTKSVIHQKFKRVKEDARTNLYGADMEGKLRQCKQQ